MDHLEKDYPARFRQIIVRSTRHMLTQVRAADHATSLAPLARAQALRILEHGLELAEAWPHARDLLLDLSPHMERAEPRQIWARFLQKGLDCSHERQTGHEPHTRAGILFHLGILHQVQGQLETARSFLNQSASLFRKIHDDMGYARSLVHLAYVERLLGQPDRATDLADRALALLDDGASERGYAHFVLGTVAYDERRWQEAIDHLQQAHHIWQQAGDETLAARSLLNLGPPLRQLGRLDEAIDCYQKAIPILESADDARRAAIARMNVGNIHLVQENYQAAIDHYHPAEAVFREKRDAVHQAMVYYNLGMAHRHLQDLTQAERAFLLALDLWEQIGDRSSQQDAVEELAALKNGR